MSKTISNEDKEKLIEECEELLEKILEERIGDDSNFEDYEKTTLSRPRARDAAPAARRHRLRDPASVA